ncbi:P-loop containing nucleoside triphosphate hydrolase protein [Cercophora newfieldiana]|uniref:P-loop containing nucleoside triphosphate hydrolase protein n=1 Tax=Cercophora newfieldiana TaxID=92897 RepID=A0AA40CKI6_9PEZI|nr:P-loop containing nucleoside triphosphate hydrolase protein [Cercophora newfieldiana]
MEPSQPTAIKLPCWLLGPEMGQCFGRSDIFSLLDQLLLPSSTTGTAQYDASHADGPRVFALSGQGGIGKTHVASEFANRNRFKFDAVFWANAETESKLSSSFNKIAAELGLFDSNDFGNAIMGRNRVLSWLSKPYKAARASECDGDAPLGSTDFANWLLVFDNADNLDLLANYWPAAGIGSIIITSRDPLSQRYMWNGSGVDLHGLDVLDAAEFLEHISSADGGDAITTKDALLLAERFSSFPIPLMRASDMLRQRNISPEELLDYCQERHFMAEIYGASTDEGAASSHAEGDQRIRDAWSYDKLKTSHPNAMRLLEVLSLLEPDCIPEFLLICEPEDAQFLPAPYPASRESYEAARAVLLKSSLIKRSIDKQALTIHRATQDSVMASLSDNDLTTAWQTAILLLDRAWPKSNFNHTRWSRRGQLLAHVECARNQYFKLLLEPDTLPEKLILTFSRLLVSAGWYVNERGNYEQVAAFVEPVIPLLENSIPQSASATFALADAHFCLGATSTWLRDAESARLHSERFLALHLAQTPSGISFSIAVAYDEVGHVRLLANGYEAGLEFARKSIAVFETLERDLGMDDPCLRRGDCNANFSRYCAAVALLKLGRLEEAESMIMSLWWRQERIWGPGLMNKEVYKTGLTISVLGSIRTMQGRLDEGYDLHLKALDHFRQTLGNSHFHVASGLVRVSEHLQRRGEHRDAASCLEEAIDIWRLRPSFAPELAQSMNKLSQVHGLMGNPTKAKGLRLRAQSILREFARNQRRPLASPLSDQDFDEFVQFWAWY